MYGLREGVEKVWLDKDEEYVQGYVAAEVPSADKKRVAEGYIGRGPLRDLRGRVLCHGFLRELNTIHVRCRILDINR